MGIEPGDGLVARPPLTGAKFVEPSAVNDAGSYVFGNGCETAVVGALGDIELRVTNECLTGGKLDIAGIARDSDFLALASTEETGVTFVDGGTVTGFAWSPISPTTLAVTGSPPADAGGFVFDIDLYKGPLLYYTLDGQSVTLGGAFVPQAIAAPSTGFFTSSVSTALFGYTPTATSSSTTRQFTQAAFGSGFSVDFSSIPPRIQDPTFTADASGAASLGVVANGSIASLTGMLADIRFDVTPTTADAG